LIAAELGDVHEQYVWRFLRVQKIALAEILGESNDPEFVAKAAHVMAPPENAIVTCVDEKPSLQALDRAQGYLKLPNGRALTGPMMPQPPCGLRSNASRLCCSKFRLCWRLWSHLRKTAFMRISP
jgi:hypothetical protein